MTKIRETPTSKIPQDWEVAQIFDLFKVETGTTPSTKKREYWDGGTINWFTPTDLSQLNGKVYIHDSARKITGKAVRDTNLTVMPKGAIVISTRAPVGYVTILEEGGTFNQGCKGLIPRNVAQTQTLFYYYHLLSLKGALQNLSAGSTFKELSKKTLENLRVPHPPLPEQKAITQVLSTVDEAIQKVDEIIAKTERLKKGLMQKLLTKGIGHKEFKDTEIGRIPKEWVVVELDDVLELMSGLYFKFSEFANKGIRCFKIDNVGFGRVMWDVVTFLPDDYVRKYQELVLKEGDIVMALNRPIINGRLKVAMLKKEDVPSILYQRVGKIIIKSQNLFNDYLFYMLISERFKNQVLRSLVGTDQPYIRNSLLLKLKIPLPPPPEQQKIASILSSVDKKLELERKRKEKLEMIKKGLMNDLLTGRKRVNTEKVLNLGE